MREKIRNLMTSVCSFLFGTCTMPAITHKLFLVAFPPNMVDIPFRRVYFTSKYRYALAFLCGGSEM
jgi:hypothetical protein